MSRLTEAYKRITDVKMQLTAMRVMTTEEKGEELARELENLMTDLDLAQGIIQNEIGE